MTRRITATAKNRRPRTAKSSRARRGKKQRRTTRRRGCGYAEGTLFPWTVSDFSLMDAIECGIVKLPRVPIADNIPGGDMPKFRELWKHVGPKMPKKGRSKSGELDPLDLPP